MAYDDSFDKQRLVSSSHLTVSQNIELRTLLNDCNRMSCAGNLTSWRWKLDAVRRELDFDMMRIDKEKKEPDKYSTKITGMIKRITPLNPLKNKSKLYLLLDEYERMLRRIQEEAGKGTKRIYDDEEDDE